MRLSATEGWSIYQSSVTWWSLRVPVGFLLAAGLARYAMDMQLTTEMGSLVLGGVFAATICLALATATRLIPLRSQLDAPPDWVAFEQALFDQGAEKAPDSQAKTPL